ncbi:MAG TPA: hypothetical protein VFG36_00200, partial [Methanoregula sp.]|nr:hypothetical protein [Methanoregula sp.]
VMILLDVPLLLLIPLILATGFVVLLLLGALTLSDIKSAFKRPKFENLKKIAFLKRLDDMKFFEKPAPPEEKPAAPRKKNAGSTAAAGKNAPVSQVRSFLSSIGSLGSVIRERSRHKKKVEHINELLDKTISEKVKSSALAGAGKERISGTGSGSSGREPPEQVRDQDPFMSLSGDEFDVSLLDGLDDSEAVSLSPSSVQVPLPSETDGPGRVIPDPDIPLPSLDISSEMDDILKNNEGGLEEFSGLEGGETIDQDFRDLENLDLENIDLDTGLDEVASETKAPQVSGGASLPDAALPVKTDWIPSDAPRDTGSAGEQSTSRSDISSFAKGASGSDDDLLSSLASDVKHVKKERNLSLLRELKDFKVPATSIEDELKETYEMLKLPKTGKDAAGIPPAKGKR